MDQQRPLTEAEKRGIEQQALNAYYGRDADALRRLIRELLAMLEKAAR